MNKYGTKYINDINKLYKGNKEITESQIQERMMRMGREVVQFNLDPTNYKEMEQIAIATIREDYLHKQE